eukprot:4792075-Ditylum_brightwellii.AAC.1
MPNDNHSMYKIATQKLTRTRYTRLMQGRLCDNIDHFNKHIASEVNMKNMKILKVRGVDSYTKCAVCNA